MVLQLISILSSAYSHLINWNPFATLLIHLILILIFCLKFKQQATQANSNQKPHRKPSNEPLDKTMPRPPALPVIGHMHLMKDYQFRPWDGFNAIRERYGNVVSLKMGVHNMVLVSDVDLFREILLKKGDIFVDRPLFPRHHIIFGGNKEHSLALCNWSKVHKDRRKMCKRGIIPSKISARQQLLEQTSLKFIKKFSKLVDEAISQPTASASSSSSSSSSSTSSAAKQYIVDKEDLLILASDVFLDFMCSEEHPRSSEEYRKFIRVCDFVFHDICQSYLVDFLPYLTSIGIGYPYLKKLDYMTTYGRDYIDEKVFFPRYKKHLERYSKANLGTSADGAPSQFGSAYESVIEEEEGDDYLDSVLKEYFSNKTNMSLNDYKIGVSDLLAGSSPVANILMRTLGFLAQDEKLQNLIYEEAVRCDTENLSNMPDLPIALASLYEGLRLASSPIVPHVATEDTTVGGYSVAKGTAILFNNFYVNLNDHLWEDPYAYNALRFLKLQENGFYKFDSPKYYMPFSMGRRQCLGHRLVETICTISISYMCLKYKIGVDNLDLTKRLLIPLGSAALNPERECYKLILEQRYR